MRKKVIPSVLLMLGILIFPTACGNKNTDSTSSDNHINHSCTLGWEYDEVNHWNKCECGEKVNIEEHKFGEWIIVEDSTETSFGIKKQICSICGYEDYEEINHKHSYLKTCYDDINHWNECECGKKTNIKTHSFGDWIIIEDSTEDKLGSKKQVCSVCNYENIVEIPKKDHIHNYSNSYTYDDINHWNECSCGDKTNVLAHVFVDGFCECGYSNASKGLSYKLLDDDTYEFSGIGECTDTNIIIPGTYNGKRVTSIGRNAFARCSSITNITIPSTVTSIKHQAFALCENLTNIELPDGITTLESHTFYGCSSLKEINIPTGITSIASNTFENCESLKSIIIPNNITSIDDNAFKGCKKLVEVFNLSSLSITKGSTDNGYLGYYAIAIHTKLEESNFLIKDEYVFIYDNNDYYLVEYIGNDTKIKLPDDINGQSYDINRYAFRNNINLTNVEISNGVINIGEYAFSGCRNLISVVIPSSIEKIEDYAFTSCYKLVEVFNFSNLSISKGTGGNGFVGYYAKVIHTNSTNSSLIEIDGYIFIYDNGDYYLVSYNGSDTNITLPSDVNGNSYKIYNRAFYFSNITSAIISNGVTSIGESSFANCNSLTCITISNSITKISNSAFNGCSNLNSVYYTGTSTEWSSITIGSYNDALTNATIYYEATL